MNSLEGIKSARPARTCSYSKAAAIALAVQLPRSPWSYTAGIFGRRSTDAGKGTGLVTWYLKSRMSGVSGCQPKRPMGSLLGCGCVVNVGQELRTGTGEGTGGYRHH